MNWFFRPTTGLVPKEPTLRTGGAVLGSHTMRSFSSRPITGAVVVFCSVAVVLLFRSRPVTDAARRLEGHVIIVENASREISVNRESAKVTVAFRIRNISDKSITVFDTDVCCGDKVATQLPLQISAASESEIVFNLTGPSKDEGEVVRTIQLFVDVRSPAIVVEVTLRLVGTGSRRISA